MTQSNRDKTILVVAAHPDDEVLGCGATVALRVKLGCAAYCLICATGIASRYAGGDDPKIKDEIAALRKDMSQVSGVIGFSDIEALDFPDNRLDTVSRQDIADEIKKRVERIRPDVIYTHHPGDYNWDHGRVFDAVMMAARHSPGEYAPSRIYCFEVPSATERARRHPASAFCPNTFVDVHATIDAKKLAMKHYQSECRPYPHPRSNEGIEYWARKRGLEVGLEYAEAFELVRSVE